jgi:hypothetical protein
MDFRFSFSRQGSAGAIQTDVVLESVTPLASDHPASIETTARSPAP